VLRGLYPKTGPRDGDGPSGDAESEPFAFRLMRRVPTMRHLAGRFIGRGVRPEHIRFHGSVNVTR
jgi:hypothetical protein